MTDQDLQQLRALVHEEITAATGDLRKEFVAANQELRKELVAAIQGLREEFTQRLDGAVEAIAVSISELRTEMNQRFERVDARIESIERRLDRVETHIHSFSIQMGGISKSLTDAERLDSRIVAVQAAQQNAIDDLYAKWKDIERRMQRPQ